MKEFLDNNSFISSIDKSNMFRELDNFPTTFSERVSLSLPKGYSSVKNIMIGGMGGSGICGDIIQSLFLERADVPVEVVKDYTLPKHIGADSLVIAISYSGNTEETLSLYDEARRRKSKIIAISNGGELEEKARKNKCPFMKVKDSLMPRTALGHLLNPVLNIILKLFPKALSYKDILEAEKILIKLHKKYTLASLVSENRAKEIAKRVEGKNIMIFGSDPITKPAAVRLKTQFNENSKLSVFYNCFPELGHNEIIGLADDPESKRNTIVICLRSSLENPELRKCIDVALEIIKPRVGEIIELCGEGKSKLAQILSLACLGDWISYYLAILRKVDPTPVPSIARFKKMKKDC